MSTKIDLLGRPRTKDFRPVESTVIVQYLVVGSDAPKVHISCHNVESHQSAHYIC
jgi:hypothetical protein